MGGEILSELKFSNLSLENQRKFLYKLYNELYFDNDFKYNKEKNLILEMIEKFRQRDNLIFLSNEKDYILMKDFTMLYYPKIVLYDSSYHIMDEEYIIIEKFKSIGVDKSKYSKNYRFEDSKKIKTIQISDVCVAIVSNLYKFFSSISLNELEKFLKENDNHILEYENLKLMSKIIKKALILIVI